MRGGRTLQKDLFDEALPIAELPVELQRNLTALLQMLLAEAADLCITAGRGGDPEQRRGRR